MNWVSWVLVAACCGLCYAGGWVARGATFEREEETGG